MIVLPPAAGAVQLTVALPLPGVAATPVGALGAVAVPPPGWNTTVAISQWVFAPVRAVAFGVAPAAGSSCSSTRRSIVLLGDTLVRTV